MTMRTPSAKARITGRDQRDPGRFAGRMTPPPVPSLGQPPPHITGNAAMAWRLFLMELPWLKSSDAALVEIAATLRGRLIDGDPPGINGLSLLQVVLSKLGASPVDVGRLSQAAPDLDKPCEFFGCN